MKKVLEYHGFESLYDLERDMNELFDPRYGDPAFKDLDPEFQGTIKVTIEYIPEGDNDAA